MAKLPMGELEARVMDVLWDADDWLTPGAVRAALRRHRVAYTTVMTILVRLCEKGRVERRRAGRAYEYLPTSGRDEFAADRMRTILETAGDRSAALSHFLEALAPGDRVRLRRMLESHRRR